MTPPEMHFKDSLKLRSVLMPAVKEGLEQLQDAINKRDKKDRRQKPPKHYRFPILEELVNGMPSYRYSETLKTDYGQLYKTNTLAALRPFADQFHQFFFSTDLLCRYFGTGEHTPDYLKKYTEQTENFEAYHTHGLIGRFCDTYIHRYGTGFDEEKFDVLYLPYFHAISSETLEVEIYAPIIFTFIESEDIPISANGHIVKIPEEILLSQAKQIDDRASRETSLMTKATHAIKLSNWIIPNPSQSELRKTLLHPAAYTAVKQTVNTAFAALRIAVPDLDTGYSHFLSVSTNWRTDFQVTLRESFLVQESHFPLHLETSFYSGIPSEIFSTHDRGISVINHHLSQSKNLDLAINRLNKACINRYDDDSIIDIAIALENILTSDSKSEITYRLATRAALLCKLSPFENHTAEEIFNLCKKIYDFRSSVVHGEPAKQQKKRLLTIGPDRTINTNEFALRFLKHIIRTIVLSPSLKGAADIDKLLFN